MFISVTLANVYPVLILIFVIGITRFIINAKSKQQLAWIVDTTTKTHAGIRFATCTQLD